MSAKKDQVIGLNTLSIQPAVARIGKSTPLRPGKKPAFTDDEWRFLNQQTDQDLLNRIAQGDQLIRLVNNPSIMNMVPAEAARAVSNLRYQQDAIRDILKARGYEF